MTAHAGSDIFFFWWLVSVEDDAGVGGGDRWSCSALPQGKGTVRNEVQRRFEDGAG
jgi:hypothetical protein